MTIHKRSSTVGRVTNREILIRLIQKRNRLSYFRRLPHPKTRDYPPELARITYTRRLPSGAETHEDCGFYAPDPPRIYLIRPDMDPGSQLAEQVAETSLTPREDLIDLAHELGHHDTYRTGGGLGKYRPDLPRGTYAEELWAWRLGRGILEDEGFDDWELFTSRRQSALDGYARGLGLGTQVDDVTALVAAGIRPRDV